MSNSSSNALKWLQLDKDEKPDNFYACLGAIVSSTFLVLRLNVPPPRDKTNSPNLLRRVWHAQDAVQICRHLCWAAMVLIAPELLVSLAFSDWRAASNGQALLQTFGRGSAAGWGKLHASFLNMSGVCLEVCKAAGDAPIDPIRAEDAETFEKLLTYTSTRQIPVNRAVHMGRRWYRVLKRKVAAIVSAVRRFWVKKDIPEQPPAHRGDVNVDHRDVAPNGIEMQRMPPDYRGQEEPEREPDGQEAEAATVAAHRRRHAAEAPTETIMLYLNAQQFVTAQIFGVVDDLPELTEEAIREKCHTSTLLKLPAIAPLLWFVVRLIVKKLGERHICQLELASATYIFCCLTAYIFTWSKPQGVEQPLKHRIQLSDVVRPLTDTHISILSFWGGSSFLSRNFWPPFGMDNRRIHPTEPIPTGTSHSVFFTTQGLGVAFFDDDFAGTVSGVIFGALYLLVWDSTRFPSALEHVFWKVAVICVTSSLIPYSVVNGILTAVFHELPTAGKKLKTHIIHVLSLYSLLGIYVFGRLYMIWGMLREFFQ